jgi:hypothetical protein
LQQPPDTINIDVTAAGGGMLPAVASKTLKGPSNG